MATEKPKLRHVSLLQGTTKQSFFINELKKNRPVIISFEGLFNNILVHYLIGYMLIKSVYQTTLTVYIGGIVSVCYLMTGCLSGWLLADFMSYFLHFVIDSETWTKTITKGHKIGYSLVDLHHEHSLNYSYLNNVELVAITYPIVIPTMCIFCVFHNCIHHDVFQTSVFYATFYMSTICIGLMTGFIHKWAHERTHRAINNKLIFTLQNYGILLHPLIHQKHHNAPSDYERTNFSLVSGVSDYVMDPVIKWWRRCK